MAKIVRMVAEVIAEKCTGCNLCTRVCPTAAFSLRDRLPSEDGVSRKIVELDASKCYNAQRCVEICPDDALVMFELAEPFIAGIDISGADPAAVEALCAKTGIPSSVEACLCTRTTMAEMAAAILLGADTPEKLSVAIGARTGCSEVCMHPLLALLAAAGHADLPKTLEKGLQTYTVVPTLFQLAGPDGKLPQDLLDAYPEYHLDKEMADLARLFASDEPLVPQPVVPQPAPGA